MKKPPDHSKFTYQPRDLESSGAVKGCVCKGCEEKRAASDKRAA